MATGTVILSLPPSGFDASAPAGFTVENSLPVLLFDDTTPEGVYWVFRMPQDYASGPVLKIIYSMASAVANNVEFEISLWAITDGEDGDTESYDAVNVGTAPTVPGTAGLIDEYSITLTNADSLAANDLVCIKMFRDADDATNDDATGDCEVRAVSLEYTTS